MKQIEPFSFVHCADLHLDSPFEGFTARHPALAERLQEATFQAFEQVIATAIDSGAAFLLIAGDVYDGANHSLRAQIRFAAALRQAVAKGIECFVVYGNHDPLQAWQAHITLPTGVHVFGGDTVTKAMAHYRGREVASIYGMSHKNFQIKTNLAQKFARQDQDLYAIGLLHCNVGASAEHADYAPCSLSDLLQANMDYWALGHIHLRQELSVNPPVVYPGNPQGLSGKEWGPKGCYLVQVGADGQTELTFKETDAVRRFQTEISIEKIETVDDLVAHLTAKKMECKQWLGKRLGLLRVDIIGRGALHERLQKLNIEQEVLAYLNEGEEAQDNGLWLESVVLNTRPLVDLEQRRQLPDLAGDFLRSADHLRATPQAVRELLHERPEYSKLAAYLDEWSEAEWLTLLEEAERIGLDLLLEGEEA